MSYYSTNHFARLPGPSEAMASRSRLPARRRSSQHGDWDRQDEDIFDGPLGHLIDRATSKNDVKTPPMEADRHGTKHVARQKQSKGHFGLQSIVSEQNAQSQGYGLGQRPRPLLRSQQPTLTTDATSYPCHRNPAGLMSFVQGAVTSEVVRNDGGAGRGRPAARGHAGGHGQAIMRAEKYGAHTASQGKGSFQLGSRSPSSEGSSVTDPSSSPPRLADALGKRGPQQSSKKQRAQGPINEGQWLPQNPPPRDVNKGKRRPAPGTGRGTGGGRGGPGAKAAMARSHGSGGRDHDRGRGGRNGAARMPSVAAKRTKEEVVTIDDDDEEVEAITVDTVGESGGRNAGAAKRQKREEGQGKCRKGGKDEVQDPVVDGDEGTGDSREEQSFNVGARFYAWSKEGACLRGVDAVTFGFGRDDALVPDQNADDIPWDTAESMVNCTLEFTPWQGLSLAWGARDGLCTEPRGRAKIEPWGRLRALHVFHSSDASEKPARGRSGQDGKVAHEDEKVYVLIAEAADKLDSPGLVNIYALELYMSDETSIPHKPWLADRKMEPGRQNRNALKMVEDRCINSANPLTKCYLAVKGEALKAHNTPGTPYVHILELLRRAADRAARPSPTPTDNGVVDVSSTPLKSQDEEQPRIPLRKSTRLQSKGKTRAPSSWPFLGSDPTVEAKLLFRYPLTKETDRVSITDLDMDRLDPGEFLNDNIIDFFFKYMLRDYKPLADLRDQLREHVHIFSTHFFSKLTEEVDDGDEGDTSDDGLPLAETRRKKPARKPRDKKQQKQHIAAHKLVHRWTKSIDIFGKKLVLVPINEALHWSLAVMCNLDEVGNLPEDQVKPGKKGNKRSFQISPVDQKGPGPRRLSQAYEDAVSQAARTELERQGFSDVTLDDDTPPAKRDAMQVASIKAKRMAAPNTEAEEAQRMDVDEDDQQGALDSQQSASSIEAQPVNKAASTGLKVIHVDLSTPQDEHEDGAEKGEDMDNSGGGGDGDGGSSDAKDDDDGEVPGDGKMSPEEQQVLKKGRPCILFMDSLGAHRADKIYGYLLNYLEQEWKKKKSELPLPPINRTTVPLIKPKVPTQTNSCDCGVFVLMYGERVLRKLVEMGMITDAHLKNSIKSLFSGNEFDMADVGRKRKALQKLFQELKEQWDAEHRGKRQGVSKEEGEEEEAKEAKEGEGSEVEGADEERYGPQSHEASGAAEAAESAAAEEEDASVAVSSPPRAASPPDIEEPPPEQPKVEALVGDAAEPVSDATTVSDDDAKPTAVAAMEVDKDDVKSLGSIVTVNDDDGEEQDRSKLVADAAVELMDVDDDDGGKAEVKSADGDVVARRRTQTPPLPVRRPVTRTMAARASPVMAQGGASREPRASREATPPATSRLRTAGPNKAEEKKRKRSEGQARGTEEEECGDVVQSDELQGEGGPVHRQLGPPIEVASDEGEGGKVAEDPEVAMITSPQSTGKGSRRKANTKRGRPAENRRQPSPRSTAASARKDTFSPVADLDHEAPATQASSQAGGETVAEQGGQEEDADDAGGHTAPLEHEVFLHGVDTEPAAGAQEHPNETIDLSEN